MLLEVNIRDSLILGAQALSWRKKPRFEHIKNEYDNNIHNQRPFLSIK